MEAFSLLKYWKATGGGSSSTGGARAKLSLPSTLTPITTIVSAVTDTDSEAGEGDDGPFFDLEFAVPDNERGDIGEEDARDELEQKLSFSPSDDLFFKGRIVHIDGSDDAVEETTLKSGQFQIPVSLAKSATKLRVFMLGLKRSKSESKQTTTPGENNGDKDNQTITTNGSNNKRMTVKLRMEEVKVPIISLLTRASSNTKTPSEQLPRDEQQQQTVSTCSEQLHCGDKDNERKKDKKEVMQKYLKMVKPLQIKVSRKSREEVKEEGTVAAVKSEQVKVGVGGGVIKQGLNLKVMAKKHLGKSKSAVVHSMPSNSSSSKKSDDSLLQQQDGIQGAILHCKRSFNSSSSSSDDGEEMTSILTRSTSDPSYEKKSSVTSAVVAELIMEEERNGVVAARSEEG